MASITPDRLSQPPSARALGALRSRWRWLLVQGAVMLVLGGAALMGPGLATLVAEALVGWLLVAAGLARLIGLPGLRHARGAAALAVATAMICFAAGAMLIWQPVAGIVLLAALLAVLFLADGAAIVMLATRHLTSADGPRWPSILVGAASAWWALAIGVVDLWLAALVVLGWPGVDARLIGLMLGVNMALGGITLLLTGIGLRTLDARPIAPASTESWRRAA